MVRFICGQTSVEMTGAVRTLDDQTRNHNVKRMQVTVESIAKASGADSYDAID